MKTRNFAFLVVLMLPFTMLLAQQKHDEGWNPGTKSEWTTEFGKYKPEAYLPYRMLGVNGAQYSEVRKRFGLVNGDDNRKEVLVNGRLQNKDGWYMFGGYPDNAVELYDYVAPEIADRYFYNRVCTVLNVDCSLNFKRNPFYRNDMYMKLFFVIDGMDTIAVWGYGITEGILFELGPDDIKYDEETNSSNDAGAGGADCRRPGDACGE